MLALSDLCIDSSSDPIFTTTLLHSSRNLKDLCRGNIIKQTQHTEGEAFIVALASMRLEHGGPVECFYTP